MPTLRDRSTRLIRMMGIGDPGTGKTGALASIANNMDELGLARIIIQDWDDGTAILSHLVKPDFQDRVHVVTLRDEYKATEFGPIVSMPKALQLGLRLMNRWKDGEDDLGPSTKWGPDTLFVCDTLTGMGDAAINFVRATNKASVDDSDWAYTADAMNRQDKYIQLLIYSLHCHIIVNSHIRFIGGGGKEVVTDKKGSHYTRERDSAQDGVGYPSALGRKLPTEIGRHFNNILEYKLSGPRRVIRTEVDGNIRLKTSIPVGLKSELKIETGLYEFFKAILRP